MYPSDRADKLLLRLPDGLRPIIKERAAIHRRSMNSEVIVLLEAAIAMESKAVAENSLQAGSATVPNNRALQGSASPTA